MVAKVRIGNTEFEVDGRDVVDVLSRVITENRRLIENQFGMYGGSLDLRLERAGAVPRAAGITDVPPLSHGALDSVFPAR